MRKKEKKLAEKEMARKVKAAGRLQSKSFVSKGAAGHARGSGNYTNRGIQGCQGIGSAPREWSFQGSCRPGGSGNYIS
jgi:hypothetical protein